MRPLSSSAAIMPALLRTRNILLRPSAWGAFLRITLAAVIAETVVVNFRYVTPHLDFGELSSWVQGLAISYRSTPGFVVLAAIAAFIALDLLLLGWYAIIRLRFCVFHAVIDEPSTVREGWRRYGKAADRLFRATLLVTFGNVALVGVLVVAVGLGVNTVMNVRTAEGKLDPGVFLLMFFPTIAFVATVVTVALLARVVLHDFILPRVALENTPVREAWRTVRKQIWADREAFFSYFLLRALFTFVGGPVLWAIGFLVLWPVFWVLGASTAGYNALLGDATGLAEVGRVALNVVMLVVGAGVGTAGAAVLGGPMAVFLRAHAMFFYGSRYKALGNVLEEQRADVMRAS